MNRTSGWLGVRLCGSRNLERIDSNLGIVTLSFFHTSTIIRRRHNAIDVILSDSGECLVKLSDIKPFVVNKFQQLFSAEGIDFPEDLLGLIPPFVSPEDNAILCRIPDF